MSETTQTAVSATDNAWQYLLQTIYNNESNQIQNDDGSYISLNEYYAPIGKKIASKSISDIPKYTGRITDIKTYNFDQIIGTLNGTTYSLQNIVDAIYNMGMTFTKGINPYYSTKLWIAHPDVSATNWKWSYSKDKPKNTDEDTDTLSAYHTNICSYQDSEDTNHYPKAPAFSPSSSESSEPDKTIYCYAPDNYYATISAADYDYYIKLDADNLRTMFTANYKIMNDSTSTDWSEGWSEELISWDGAYKICSNNYKHNDNNGEINSNFIISAGSSKDEIFSVSEQEQQQEDAVWNDQDDNAVQNENENYIYQVKYEGKYLSLTNLIGDTITITLFPKDKQGVNDYLILNKQIQFILKIEA